jgi:Cys-rich repeat protein
MNTDCAETTGQCNPATNECVTCVENSVCPAGQICDLTTFECEDGCVGGSGGANCGPEAVCNPSEGPNGTCVACLQDSDCPADNICGTTSNGIPACVPGCHTDDQCNPTVTNQVCNPSDGPNGTCVDCVRDSQCPSGMVCDQTTFMCRCHETGEDCSQDSDCGYRLVPAADGGMTGICDSQEGRCIDQVQCGPEGESVTTQIRPTCTLIAQGLADQCTPAQGNCPTNWVVELAAGSSGVFAKVCVPSQDECLAPYCGN